MSTKLLMTLGLTAPLLLVSCTKTEKGKKEVVFVPVSTQELVADVNTPNPEEVQIRSMAYAGSGCPANTVSHNISPDAKALTLLFAEYAAEAGPDIDVALSRKNCQLTLDLHAPAGWSYSLFKLDARGFATLEDGVRGEVKSTYYFQGEQISETFSETLTGPTSDGYQTSSTANVDAEVFSSCDGASRALNINTEILVDNSADATKAGFMTVDSVDGEFTHLYGIKWERCNPTPPPPPPPPPTQSPLKTNSLIAVGPGAGSSEPVRIFDTHNGGYQVAQFHPFGTGYTGGYRVALADVNGDGYMDLIAGTEKGQTPRVVVISGATSGTLLDFSPFPGTGGVHVAAGDTDGDGAAEIVAAAGEGVAPEVKVYKAGGTLLRTVMVYEPSFLAGVRVAMGDFNGDGILDIATATPPGGGPRVKILNGANLATLADGFVYEPEFRGGVWIAAGDVDGDGKAEIITGADAGGGPRVRVLSAEGFVAKNDFFPYDSALRTGVRVASVDHDGDGKFELVVAPGVGGGPHIRVMNALTGQDAGPGSFFGADPASRQGFYVSGAIPMKKP